MESYSPYNLGYFRLWDTGGGLGTTSSYSITLPGLGTPCLLIVFHANASASDTPGQMGIYLVQGRVSSNNNGNGVYTIKASTGASVSVSNNVLTLDTGNVWKTYKIYALA